MGLSYHSLREQQKNEATMGVILKQRTWQTVDGRAVPEGHRDARFLIGPKGSEVTNETANKLGLMDGHLPESDPYKEQRGPDDTKEDRQGREDKSGRRVPNQGYEDQPVVAPTPESDRVAKIQTAMLEIAAEAEAGNDIDREALLTGDGKPDARVLSNRAGELVSAKERDEIWTALDLTIAPADETPDDEIPDDDDPEDDAANDDAANDEPI